MGTEQNLLRLSIHRTVIKAGSEQVRKTKFKKVVVCPKMELAAVRDDDQNTLDGPGQWCAALNNKRQDSMSEFFIGQIMMAGFNFAPKFWALANGQLLPINQNQALFSLLGTQYGGNGTTNFALPDLRSRTPIGYASSVDPSWQPPAVQIGQSAGVENVTLLSTNLPSHTHSVNASTTAGDNRNPSTRVFATSTNSSSALNMYGPSNGALVPLNPQTVSPAGGNQPHPNLQPYSVINFCIALSGIYPSRN